jgi:hypothetical protein
MEDTWKFVKMDSWCMLSVEEKALNMKFLQTVLLDWQKEPTLPRYFWATFEGVVQTTMKVNRKFNFSFEQYVTIGSKF